MVRKRMEPCCFWGFIKDLFFFRMCYNSGLAPRLPSTQSFRAVCVYVWEESDVSSLSFCPYKLFWFGGSWLPHVRFGVWESGAGTVLVASSTLHVGNLIQTRPLSMLSLLLLPSLWGLPALLQHWESTVPSCFSGQYNWSVLLGIGGPRKVRKLQLHKPPLGKEALDPGMCFSEGKDREKERKKNYQILSQNTLLAVCVC